MKRWRRVVAALALVSIIALFGFALIDRPADPVFEGKFASQWTAELLQSNYTTRENAKAALKVLGEPAVPQLRVLLRKRNGPWEKPLLWGSKFLPFLNYSAVDADACRAVASEMLGQLGEKSRAAVPDLVDALAFDRSAGETERALVRISSASVSALEAGLNSRNSKVRMRCARLLREIFSTGESTVPALVAATRDDSPEVRKEAALSIGAILGRMTVRTAIAESAVDALISVSRDASTEVRAAATHALGQAGTNTPEVLAALRRGLSDSSAEVSLECAIALWALRQPPDEIVRVLISILDTRERWRAAYALADMGPSAAPAVPALVQLLIHERVPRPFRTPASSAFALGKIGSPAIPELAPTLSHPDSRVRMNALMAFSFMGNAGRGAVPHVMQLLGDKNSEVRHTTALTLAAIGAEPNEIVDGLSDCLQAEDIYMRFAAAAHLRKIAPDGNWIVPAE